MTANGKEDYFCTVKLPGRILDVILYSSLFTACCALGLCMATEKLVTSVPPPLFSYLHFLVFGSSLIVYNIPKVFLVAAHKRTRIGRYWYFIFIAAGLCLMVYSLLSLPGRVVVLSVVLGAFAFAYSLPLLPFKNKKRLREFWWVKILVLAGVWTTATSVLPMVCLDIPVANYPVEILLRFVFIFALCVLFDVRDIHTDLQSNIDTLPQKIGAANSYKLIYISVALFAALSLVQYSMHPYLPRVAGAMVTATLTVAVVLYLKKFPSAKAYLLLADGVMLVYSTLVLLH